VTQIYQDHKQEVDKLTQDLSVQKKSNRLTSETQKEKEMLEISLKQKMEAEKQKGKKDLKSAQEKARVDTLNATEGLKNELAKAKVEWERERKKICSDSEDELNRQRATLDEEMRFEMKETKDK
jgi:hypothetical protein